MVLPALHRASARQRRDRALRPVVVQPRRRREGHGILYAPGTCTVPAPDAGLRADADRRRDSAAEVLVFGIRQRTAAPVQGEANRPRAAMETQPDGSAIAESMGRLFTRQGRDDGPHRHPVYSVVRRRFGCQEAISAEYERPWR